MKAPTDKRNDTIQILVTRACDLFNCSNCTQLLPFRRDAVHMSVECFQAAVRSVKDWPGVVGIFGGNPCAHPQFDVLCAILMNEIPEQRRRGLWANSFMGKGRIVRRTFYPYGRFNLNPHGDAKAAAEMEQDCPGRLIRKSTERQSLHAGILLDRRDLGVDEPTWIGLRENCDINLNWSAGIREVDGKPYVYFCEVAAALDGVRGVNNGILAEPGWWAQKMPFFERQVRECCDAGCGVPLRRIGHEDRADTYDVTPQWMNQLQAQKGKVNIVVKHELPEGEASETTDYMRLRT